MSSFAVIFPLGRQLKRTEEKRREEKRKKIREEMRRQGKGTEKNIEGFAPYATTKNVDICRGGAGQLMRGRGELWAGHL
jgi:hypothetical protein